MPKTKEQINETLFNVLKQLNELIPSISEDEDTLKNLESSIYYVRETIDEFNYTIDEDENW